MKDLQLFYDKEKQMEITDGITFKPLLAGKVTRKTIYLYNPLPYILNLKINLSGEHVKLIGDVKELAPKKTKSITLEFDPILTIMKPITANLKIDGNYIVG